MENNSLAVVRQAAESKPDDPIYRLVLAMLPEKQSHLRGSASLPRGAWFIGAVERSARAIKTGVHPETDRETSKDTMAEAKESE